MELLKEELNKYIELNKTSYTKKTSDAIKKISNKIFNEQIKQRIINEIKELINEEHSLFVIQFINSIQITEYSYNGSYFEQYYIETVTYFKSNLFDFKFNYRFIGEYDEYNVCIKMNIDNEQIISNVLLDNFDTTIFYNIIKQKLNQEDDILELSDVLLYICKILIR